MTIDEKLQIYGPSLCPICGDRRETVFAGERYQLTCRKHPGHPLYVEPQGEAAAVELVSV